MRFHRAIAAPLLALLSAAALIAASYGCHSPTKACIVPGAAPGSSPAAAPLGTTSTFVILAGSTVTNTGATTTIVGNVGVSPGSAITGIPAGQPTGGALHSADAAAATAQSDLTVAYNDLAGRARNATMSGVDLGGRTFQPGVFFWSSSAQLTGAVRLDAGGDPNAVFIFQMGSTLTTASNASVVLINGADAKRVFWQVGSSATLGTGTAFKGSILAQASITLNSGATLSGGRALARTGAVTLNANTVALP
jgi:type VI secretion system secreted protein VgrG